MKIETVEGKLDELVVRRDDGKICPHFFIDSKHAKRFSDYSGIRYDLWHSMQLVKLIEKYDDHDVEEALWMSAVVRYRRCFSRTDGRTKLDKKDIDPLGQEWVSYHQGITDIRNDYIAHSHKNHMESSKVAIVLHSPDEKKEISRIDRVFAATNKISKEELGKFVELCELLCEIVQKREEKAAMLAMDEYKNLDIDELYEKAK